MWVYMSVKPLSSRSKIVTVRHATVLEGPVDARGDQPVEHPDPAAGLLHLHDVLGEVETAVALHRVDVDRDGRVAVVARASGGAAVAADGLELVEHPVGGLGVPRLRPEHREQVAVAVVALDRS